MKTVSKLALVALFATGAGSMAIATPAFAKDKKQDAAAPGLKFSPDVIKVAKPAQDAMIAKDYATAETNVVAVEAAAKTDDDKYIAAALRYDLENQKIYAAQTANPKAPVNETVLVAPLDTLIASPSTPATDRARYTYRRGALSFNGKQYPQALQYFTKAKELGYSDPNLNLQIIQSKIGTGDLRSGLADLDTTITQMNTAGQKAPEDYYRYAIGRTATAKMIPEEMFWLKKYVTAYPTAKNWRDVIVNYGLQPGSVAVLDDAQKIDLFRLMRATGSLADQIDYLDYADKVSRKGLPTEAQAVVKEGIAGGKVPASNGMAKALLTDTAAAIRNDGPLAALDKKAAAAPNGKLAAGTADAYLGENDYAKAIALYRLALSKGSVNADEVNTHLGIALARSGDKAGAKAAFAAVVGAPRVDIAGLWTAWLDSAPAA